MQTSSHDRNLSFSNPDQITIKRTKPKINSEDSKKLTLITEVSQTIKEQIKQENIGLNSNRNAINLDQSKFGRPETTYSGLLKNFTIDEDSSRNNRSTLPKFSRPSFILDKIVHETPNENLHDRKRSMTSGDLLDRNVLVSGPNSESQQILVGKLTDDGTLNNKLAIESNNSKSENRRKSMLSGSTSFKKEYPHLHRIKTTKENFSIISEQSAEQNSVTQAIQNDQIPASELLIGQDGNAQTPGSRLSRKSFYNNDSTPIDSDVNDRTSGLLRPNRTRISRKQKTEINDIVNTTDFDDDKSLSLPTAENIKAMKNRNKLIIKKLTSTNDVSESMLQFVALNTKAVMSLDFAKEETILNSPSSSNEDNSKVIQPTEQEIPKTTILPLVAPKTENEDYKLVEIKKSTKPSQNSKSASRLSCGKLPELVAQGKLTNSKTSVRSSQQRKRLHKVDSTQLKKARTNWLFMYRIFHMGNSIHNAYKKISNRMISNVQSKTGLGMSAAKDTPNPHLNRAILENLQLLILDKNNKESNQKVENILCSHFPDFRKFNAKERILFSSLIEIQKISKDSIVIKEGHASVSFYLVFSGQIEIFRLKGELKYTLDIIHPGFMFGELQLCVPDAVRQYNGRCLENCTLLVIPKVPYIKFLQEGETFSIKSTIRISLELLPLFQSNLGKQCLDKLGGYFKIFRFEKGQEVQKERHQTFSLYWILEGTCKLTRQIPVKQTRGKKLYIEELTSDQEKLIQIKMDIQELGIGQWFPPLKKFTEFDSSQLEQFYSTLPMDQQDTFCDFTASVSSPSATIAVIQISDFIKLLPTSILQQMIDLPCLPEVSVSQLQDRYMERKSTRLKPNSKISY